MPDQPNAVGTLPRHMEGPVREALLDTRIVALVGPRQAGKTTLARKIASETGMAYATLDDPQIREFAAGDPNGFMRDLGPAVIDEIQRAPELFLALKKAVDDDPRPGRFLITGSVDLFRGSASPDSLAGRVETFELLPFSQSELAGRTGSRFLTRAFEGDFPALEETGRTPDLIERIVAGGYPEAIARANPARRRAWLVAYARSLAERDAPEISPIAKVDELSRLLDHAALASGRLANASALAMQLSVDGKTVDRWLALLEQMFVLRRVRAWHRNELKRLVRTPRLHFLDAGLLAALRRVTAEDIEVDRSKLGPLLEGFVYTELVKLAASMPVPVSISHYRDKDKVEVDFVLEQGRRVVGVEVKAAATVKTAAIKGLNRLREATGKAFACGIVLHDCERVQRIGDRIFAVPICQLWA